MITRMVGILAVLFALAVLPVGAVGLATYQASGGAYVIGYPAGWEVTASGDGRVVAFLGPAASVKGAEFRPNLVVSVTPLPVGTSDAQVVATAEAALAKTMPALRRLGREVLTAQDGRAASVGYYTADGPPARLYLVLGLAQRGENLFVVIGTSSPDLPAYRAHAASYRAAIASLRVR